MAKAQITISFRIKIVSENHRADALDLISNLTNLLNEIIQELKNCKSEYMKKADAHANSAYRFKVLH